MGADLEEKRRWPQSSLTSSFYDHDYHSYYYYLIQVFLTIVLNVSVAQQRPPGGLPPPPILLVLPLTLYNSLYRVQPDNCVSDSQKQYPAQY